MDADGVANGWIPRPPAGQPLPQARASPFRGMTPSPLEGSTARDFLLETEGFAAGNRWLSEPIPPVTESPSPSAPGDGIPAGMPEASWQMDAKVSSDEPAQSHAAVAHPPRHRAGTQPAATHLLVDRELSSSLREDLGPDVNHDPRARTQEPARPGGAKEVGESGGRRLDALGKTGWKAATRIHSRGGKNGRVILKTAVAVGTGPTHWWSPRHDPCRRPGALTRRQGCRTSRHPWSRVAAESCRGPSQNEDGSATFPPGAGTRPATPTGPLQPHPRGEGPFPKPEGLDLAGRIGDDAGGRGRASRSVRMEW